MSSRFPRRGEIPEQKTVRKYFDIPEDIRKQIAEVSKDAGERDSLAFIEAWRFFWANHTRPQIRPKIKKLAKEMPGRRHSGRGEYSSSKDDARLQSALNGESLKGPSYYVDERTRGQIVYGGNSVDVHTWTRYTVPEALDRLAMIDPQRVHQALDRMREAQSSVVEDKPRAQEEDQPQLSLDATSQCLAERHEASVAAHRARSAKDNALSAKVADLHARADELHNRTNGK